MLLKTLPILVLFLVGCSHFEEDYARALENPGPRETPEGSWEGTWESLKGHGGGGLRAVVTRIGPDTYYARFMANYVCMGVDCDFEQEVELRAAPPREEPVPVSIAPAGAHSAPPAAGPKPATKPASKPAPLRASGHTDLGWPAGGIYHYDVTMTPTRLEATYKSEEDQGTFQMVRPGE